MGRRVTCLVWVCLATTALAKEKKVDLPAPPPMVRAVQATCFVRESTEIHLQAMGRITEPLRFVIRRPPRRGTLGEVRVLGGGTGVITYTPFPNAGPGEDAFSFAAQAAGSPVSAQAAVRIEIVERPAKLEFPREIQLGEHFLGDSVEGVLPISNFGGQPARVLLAGDDTWSFSSSSVTIPAGAEREVKIRFSPKKAGTYERNVRIGAQPADSVTLSASALDPLALPANGIEVSAERTPEQVFSFPLKNLTNELRRVEIQWPAVLHGASEFALAAGETMSVEFRVGQPLTEAVDAHVLVRSGGYAKEVPLKVYPRAARLEVSGANPQIDLGVLRPGKEARGTIEVKNTGEAGVSLQTEAPDGWTVQSGPKELLLGGGKKREIEFAFVPVRTGTIDETLLVRPSAGEPLRIPVRAMVRENPSIPVQDVLTVPQVPTPAQPAAPVVSTEATVNLVSATPHEVVLSWRESGSPPAGYRIQRRVVRVDAGGGAQTEWVDFSGSRFDVRDGDVFVTLSHLPPDTKWTARVLDVDASGITSGSSPAFQFATLPRPEIRLPDWIWMILGGAGVGFLFWVWRKLRRAANREVESELERLERDRK